MMKKITCLMLFFCCFIMATAYAGPAAKKKSDAERIAQLEQENAALQQKMDSISKIANEQDSRIRQLETANTTTATNTPSQLQTRLTQSVATQTEQDNDKKEYIKNKKYYPFSDGTYCEEYALCKNWAHDMAEKWGKDFRINKMGKKTRTETQFDRSFSSESSGKDAQGNTVYSNKAMSMSEKMITTTTVTLEYTIKNESKTKSFECNMEEGDPNIKENWKCKWLE